MNFREFLNIVEGGAGSGTKFTGSGLNAGGQAQAGRGMTKPSNPQTKTVPFPPPPSEMTPGTPGAPPGWVAGFSPFAAGVGNSKPQEPPKPGWMGAGKSKEEIEGGSFGGGGPKGIKANRQGLTPPSQPQPGKPAGMEKPKL